LKLKEVMHEGREAFRRFGLLGFPRMS